MLETLLVDENFVKKAPDNVIFAVVDVIQNLVMNAVVFAKEPLKPGSVEEVFSKLEDELLEKVKKERGITDDDDVTLYAPEMYRAIFEVMVKKVGKFEVYDVEVGMTDTSHRLPPRAERRREKSMKRRRR